jgi:hypothetical protein
MYRAATLRALPPGGWAAVVAAILLLGCAAETPPGTPRASTAELLATPYVEMTARGGDRRVRLPSSIDATGSSNVTSQLQSFINSAPDGSTIVFKAGGTYRLDSALVISGRRNLTLEGNGARLELTGTSGRFESIGIRVEVSTGTTIRNFTMVGNDSEAGTSAACCSREAQHGIAVLSADATLIEDMDIRRVWGDCVYVNYRFGLAGDWSDGVTFRDSTCTLTGRHGVGLIAGKNVRIERNVFDQIGYMIVDIEPNDSSGGASDVLVADNTIGSYGLTDQYVAAVLSAGGPDTGAPVTNVTVTRNTVAGNRAGYDGAVLGVNIRSKGDRGPRSGFTITDNVGQMTAKGPLMTFTETDGVTVTGNTQPLSSGELATFPSSTNVTYVP